ncbi:nucleotidyltransferase family protein [Lacibacter sp. MH-610]
MTAGNRYCLFTSRLITSIHKIQLLCIVYTLEQILNILRTHKPELQRKYPVSKLGVFGSYARGEAGPDSDIDIAVELNGNMGLNFVAMADEIEALFGIKTDVVPLRSIKPKYLPYVQKDIVYA